MPFRQNKCLDGNAGFCTVPFLPFIGISNDAVDEVYMGNVCQAMSGQAPTRQAMIFAGW